MDFFVVNIILIIVPSVFGTQSQYHVVLENFTTEYVNQDVMNLTSRVYKISNTIAVDVAFLLKVNLPETTKVNVKGYIKDYKIQVLQVDKTLKDAVEMESFDVQSLLIRNARPPVVWPLKKGVSYRITGWVPDSSKFPPNLPEGSWKLQATLTYPNKTKVMEVYIFCKLIYKRAKTLGSSSSLVF